MTASVLEFEPTVAFLAETGRAGQYVCKYLEFQNSLNKI